MRFTVEDTCNMFYTTFTRNFNVYLPYLKPMLEKIASSIQFTILVILI